MPDRGGFAIWLTGLPACGKSTLAAGLAQALKAQDMPIQVLDSDELRRVLTPQAAYNPQERDWFYQVMAYIGQLLTQNGVNVVFAATANRRHYRDLARREISRFAEVYVRCSLETCMARDPKGLYAKAQAGQITTLSGLQAPYEAPENPILTVDTEHQTP